MRTPKKRSVHEHIAAIVVAIVLVTAISVGINQSGMLTADILHGNTVLAAGDVSYAVSNNTLTLYSEKTFADVKSLTFMVVYNPEAVHIKAEDISTSYDYTSSSGKDGVQQVTVFLPSNLSAGDTLLQIPFEGKSDEINISDATMLFNEGTIDGLAIKKQ